MGEKACQIRSKVAFLRNEARKSYTKVISLHGYESRYYRSSYREKCNVVSKFVHLGIKAYSGVRKVTMILKKFRSSNNFGSLRRSDNILRKFIVTVNELKDNNTNESENKRIVTTCYNETSSLYF